MNPRTRVKICGITRPEDGIAAAQVGVDAIGLVFYEKSPRNVSVEQAKVISDAMPAFVTTVALFLDPDEEKVYEVLANCPIDLLQFHGNEPAEFCDKFHKPYIKALGMAGKNNLAEQINAYPSARGLLLDSHEIGAAGGTGETFNWDEIPADLRKSIILAGGLNPDNVGDAIGRIRPYGVDLSSGVESEPGIKDVALIEKLMIEVNKVNCE